MLRSKCKFIIENYFILICINALIIIFTQKAYLQSILFPTTLIFYSIIIHKKGRTNLYDIIIGILFFWMITTWIFNSYNHKLELILRCVLGQIAFMMAYYIGKYDTSNLINKILQKAFFPLAICGILGLIWYFYPPGWYFNRTLQALENSSTNGLYTVLELFRLRSIFTSPYEMSYMCALCNIFIIFNIYQAYQKEKKQKIYVSIFIITMLFCMMRAPIVCCILSFFTALFYNGIYHGKFKTLISTIFAVVTISFIIGFILNSLDPEILDFITSKFTSVTEDSNELVDQRVNLWDYSYNLWGDGAGRHAIYSDDYNPDSSIRDSEYVKILVEQGYIGLGLYIILFLLLIIKCIRHFKYLTFELCIIIFYCITMVGANSITTPDKHCFIFWLIVGKIASFKKSNPNNTIQITQ